MEYDACYLLDSDVSGFPDELFIAPQRPPLVLLMMILLRLPLEELLLLNVPLLFPGHDLQAHCSFRILRDSDLELEEEAEDLVLTFESALKRRRRGKVVRIETDRKMPENLHEFIIKIT